MVRPLNGLILMVTALCLIVQANSASAQTDSNNRTYSSYPQAAGQRTLIDFNEYGGILKAAQAYVNQRYSLGKIGETAEEVRVRLGAEKGQPLAGFAEDPDGHPDTHKVRPITDVDSLFGEIDTLRPQQKVTKDLRASSETRNRDAIYMPAAGAAAGTTGTPAATTPAAAEAVKPRDEVGAIQYLVSQEDMVLDNWLVELNSSARTTVNRKNSYAKEVKSYPYDKSETYLGIRVHFPEHKYNAYAKIGPAFEIPAFDARGLPVIYSRFDKDFKDGTESDPNYSYNGVMHNVSQIKNVVAKVSGRNYPHGFAVRMRDQNGEVSEYFLGYLDYIGWRFLRWDNPNYITQYSAEELFRIPLYPTEVPYRVFDSFVIYRNGNHMGGDFVTYVAWVKMDFDLAISPDELNEINVDDDGWWYIMRDANADRNKRLLQKYASEIDKQRQQEGRTRRPNAFPDKMVIEAKTKNPAAGASGAAPTPAPTR